MNRWVLRVAAYVSLMSDTYPPFRLDMGGDDPGTAKLSGPPPTGPGVATVAGPAAPSASTQASGRTGGWSAGRIVAVVVGAILVFSGVTVLGGGATALWVDRAVRDEAGFVTSGSGQLSTPSYALVSESIAVHSEGLDWSLSERLLGDVRVQARPGGAAPVFVGIASTADVRDYLAGVEHATVTEFRDGAAAYREQAGGTPRSHPAGPTSGSRRRVLPVRRRCSGRSVTATGRSW